MPKAVWPEKHGFSQQQLYPGVWNPKSPFHHSSLFSPFNRHKTTACTSLFRWEAREEYVCRCLAQNLEPYKIYFYLKILPTIPSIAAIKSSLYYKNYVPTHIPSASKIGTQPSQKPSNIGTALVIPFHSWEKWNPKFCNLPKVTHKEHVSIGIWT